MSIGYAAFQTNLTVNAKGNINEKEHIIMGGKKVYTTTENDGLYKNLNEQIIHEKSVSTASNVGLMQASDIIKSNTNNTQCGNYYASRENKGICKTTSYIIKANLVNGKFFWTINPANPGWDVIGDNVDVIGAGPSYPEQGNVIPVIYLKSNIKLEGNGTKDNPFIITN